MTGPIKRMVGVAAFCVLLCSCGEPEQFRKETYPVTGIVNVDGKPAAGLQVTCHDLKGLDTEHPSLSSGMTNQEGKFEISTYESSDGMPAGDYVLTFMWGQMNSMKRSYDGPDKLNNRYLDPKTSKTKFTVVEGEPIDLETIQLTTK